MKLFLLVRVVSNPIADLNTVFMNNDTIYNGNESNFEIMPGHSYYWDYIINSEKINSRFNELDIQIETTNGTISGVISLPDTVNEIIYPDTMDIDKSAKIEWIGSEADFYYVYWYYYYPGRGTSDGSYIASNSIEIDSSLFPHDGYVWFEITPVNGPFDDENANFIGDGYGFVYYENKRFKMDKLIVIGNGYGISLNKPISNNNNSLDIINKEKDKLMKNLQDF